MRQFSENVVNVLTGPLIEALYCVSIEGLYDTTNHFENVVLSDSSVYQANGALLSVDPPRMSTTVDREQFSLLLVDNAAVVASFVNTGFIGRRVDVKLVLVDQSDGQLMTDIADTITVYRGTIDSAVMSADTNRIGKQQVKITCASPMADLDLKKQFFTSKDFIRGRNASDSCCDQIYAGSGTLTLRWGKK